MSFHTLFLLCCGTLPLLSAHADTLSFSTRAEAFSDPVSIDAFTSGWHDQLSPGDDAALHARMELRNDHGPWHVAWRWRYDYQLEFSPGTAELYHAVQNHLPVEAGRRYPLDIRAYHVERHGPAIGYRVERQPFQLELSLILYQGLELTDGQTQGHAAFVSEQPASDQLNDLLMHVNYRYSAPELHEEELDWNPKSPDGWGYGLDVTAQWLLPTGTRLNLQVDDLIGAMRWRKTPETVIDLRCDCTLPDYDLNGGLAIRRQYTQRLKPLLEFTAQHPLTDHWQLHARLLNDTWLTSHQFGILHQRQSRQFGVWYEPAYRAWRLSYEQPHVRLSWTADNLDTSEAHRLGVDIALFSHW